MIIKPEKPSTAFIAFEKDLNLIIRDMMNNERLKRLLYYTTPDALEKPFLTEQQSHELIGKNIRTVPKLIVDGSVLQYVIINFDNFVMSSNPEFRDNVIEFDIICHFDQWQLNDLSSRPYKIAAEIDTMMNKKRLTGIGKTEFIGMKQMVLTDEFAGLCLMYQVYHGGEDQQKMPTPKEEEIFLNDFAAMMENKKNEGY